MANAPLERRFGLPATVVQCEVSRQIGSHVGLAIWIAQCNNRDVQRIRFTQSARRHRIGKARVIEAMNNAGEPERIPASGALDARLVWIGPDDRGVVLEVVGVERPDYLLIIHAMPYAYRRKP